MRNLGAFLFIVFLLGACNSVDDHGYSSTKTGLKYKIHSIGDVDHVIHDSDVCTFDFQVYTLQDSLLYSTSQSEELLFTQKKDTGWMEWIELLAVNDSSTAILSSAKLKAFIPDLNQQDVKVSMVIRSAQPYKQWRFYKKYPELSERDLELEEQVDLQRILLSYVSDSIQWVNGIFMINQITGSGSLPIAGDEVVIHSSGKTLDGKLVESTAHRSEAFSYIIGQKDQVLPGFDLAVRNMRKGAKSIAIVPSYLAYGSSGSSTGIVRPYKTLIFEIEVLELNSPAQNE